MGTLGETLVSYKMNKYMQYSKAKPEAETLTWKKGFDPINSRWKVTFSDGDTKSFRHEADMLAYINQKFFSMYCF